MTRPSRNTALSVTLALLVTACGSGGGSGQAGGTGPSAPTEDATSETMPGLVTPSFSEQAASAGLTLSHGFNLSEGQPLIDPMWLSGGVTAGDYDGDGYLDLYWVAGDVGSNRLYRNRGDGIFTDVTREAGLWRPGIKSAGPAFVDMNGNGHLDLFVGAIDGDPTLVYRNNGDGTFTDVTQSSGLSFNAANTLSASFGDLNGSGYPDGLFTHWGNPIEAGKSPEILWINVSEGEQIRFEDRSLAWGLDEAYENHFGTAAGGGNRPDFAFVASLTDLERDGDTDVLLASDFGTTKVLRNDGGRLVNITNTGVIKDENGMGSALGDYDRDGDTDWFVTSIHPNDPDASVSNPFASATGNKLYRNEGDGQFTQLANSLGVASGGWGWAACFADFDLDGWLDLFQVNGWAQPDPSFDQFREDFSRLFMQTRPGQFEQMANTAGLNDSGEGRGLVCEDFNRDGRPDLIISNNQQPPGYWQNRTETDSAYLSLALKGRAPNTQALGARIDLVRADGVTLTRELRLNAHYVSSGAAEVHFGLGGHEGPVDVVVTWPDGTETFFEGLAVNRFVTLEQPQ